MLHKQWLGLKLFKVRGFMITCAWKVHEILFALWLGKGFTVTSHTYRFRDVVVRMFGLPFHMSKHWRRYIFCKLQKLPLGAQVWLGDRKPKQAMTEILQLGQDCSSELKFPCVWKNPDGCTKFGLVLVIVICCHFQTNMLIGVQAKFCIALSSCFGLKFY